jgi:superfamily II DNA or RNA helicase
LKNFVTFHLENIWTTLKPSKPLSDTIIKIIYSDLSYKTQEYSRFRKTTVEFQHSLFDKTLLKYPTGLTSSVIKILKDYDIDFEIQDERNEVEPSEPIPIHVQLRDYQEETVQKAIAAERGIIKIATGGGKTVVAASIIARLNVKTIFIVNSLDLLEQAYDEFVKILKVPIGKIGGGYCEIEKINVCTIQTLHKALGLKFEIEDEDYFIDEEISDTILTKKEEIIRVVKNAELIINDECHHMAAGSYVNIMCAAMNSRYKFGLSATPFRNESIDLVLYAYSGKEIVNISASFLIEKGFLVKPTIYFLDPNELGKYKFIRKSFQTLYKEWIVNNPNRNNLIVDCVDRFMQLDKTVLITVTQIKHGQIILDLIKKRLPNAPVAFIKGEVKKDVRKQLLNSIREKKLKVLIGTSLADEGLDLPALDAAIIAGGGKSLIKALQRVGRTLRLYPGKTEAIIVDFYDNLRYLTSQSRTRMKIYMGEKLFDVRKHF